MEAINKANSEFIIALMHKIKNGEDRTFRSRNNPSLIIELRGEVETTQGKGLFVNLCHHDFKDGDHWRNPEIEFLVFVKEKSQATIIPGCYLSDEAGIYENSLGINSAGEIVVNTPLQKKHTAMANEWLEKLQTQGYL